MGRRKQRLSFLAYPRQAVIFQKKAPLTLPLRERLETLRYGFKGSMYAFYDLAQNDPRDFLPDTHARAANRINGGFCQAVLGDKLLFNEVLKGYFPLPQVLALIDRGKLYPASRGASVHTLTALLAYCHDHTGIILKPSRGSLGRGIWSLRASEGGYLLNGRAATQNELEAFLKKLDDYLVTELIQQQGPLASIFPGSLNTMRIITMQDAEGGPFIPVALHRFGVRSSIPTDNAARGGLMARINLETGELGPAVRFPERTGGKLTWTDVHPDTDERIEGVVLEGWHGLKAQLLETLSELRFLKYVGWDIAISDGTFWLVEGNARPSLAIQIFCPYLKNPETRRFFEYHKVA